MILLLSPAAAFQEILILARMRVARMLRVDMDTIEVSLEQNGDKVIPKWEVDTSKIPEVGEANIRGVIAAIWQYDLRHEARNRMAGMLARREGPKAKL